MGIVVPSRDVVKPHRAPGSARRSTRGCSEYKSPWWASLFSLYGRHCAPQLRRANSVNQQGLADSRSTNSKAAMLAVARS
jgi:hypothetical protein